MSRAFVDNDQGYDASPRVYVNNMNTPHATVGLPERRPNQNNTNNIVGNRVPMSQHDSDAEAAARRSYAGGLTSTRDDTTRGGAQTGLKRASGPTTARGDPVHANLQDVYTRIMRRLQRQMNYAELSRGTLAEQYGVELEMAYEAANDGGEHDGGRLGENNNNSGAAATVGGSGGAVATTTPLQTFSSQTDYEVDALGEDSRPASQSLSRPVSQAPGTGNAAAGASARGRLADMKKDAAASSSAGGGGVGANSAMGTSRLLQYKQQQLPSASAADDLYADDDAPGKGRSDADVEKEMSEQPCPRPLRLVVQHVLDTLLKKMTLAENGSLRDCVIFSFESRALLDRLLKEIPLYTQYTAHLNGGSSTQQQQQQQAISGVYQQLRKRPVLLPRGAYVEDAATGGIRAELLGEGNASTAAVVGGFGGGRGSSAVAAAATTNASALSRDASAAHLLPNTTAATTLPALANANPFGTNNNSTPSAGASVAGALSPSSLPDIALPASYGKSSRLAASISRQNAGAGGGFGSATAPGSPAGGTAALSASAHQRESPFANRSRSSAGQPQRSFRHGVLRDHLANGNASVSLAGESLDEGSDVMTGIFNGGDDFGGRSSNAAAAASIYHYPVSDSAAAAAHRATQRISMGTITDDNGVTTVPQSEYAALQRRVEELQTQLAEVQLHRSALAEQLCEEEQYTDQKKRIVQYLRETLVRECNMLRTQLHQANMSGGGGTSAGKGAHGQRVPGSNTIGGGGNGAASGVFREGTLVSGGLNASTRSWIRQPKQTNEAVLSSSTTTMGVSALMTQQQKPSFEHGSDSGSLASVYGGNFSVGGTTMNATIRNGGRSSPQPRLGGGGGAGLGASRNSPGLPGGARSDAAQAEVEAVHSLIDLALLAVEEEAVLPPHTAQLLHGGHGDKDVLRSGFRKNAKQQLDELRVDFEERQQALKKSLLQQTAEHNYVMAEQQSEVARLRSLTDTTRVRAILQESVSEIRAELQRVKMQVAEQLHFFKAILHSTGQGLLHRAALVDSTMSDNVVLSSTLSATKELIESATTLFLPMLTREYECGYHPWPLKVRNSRDPLAHIVQLRFGQSEVVRLRDSLSEFGKLYVAIHQYVMGHAVLPESARPMTGKPLEDLCAALALNPMSHTDIVFAVRRCHDVEGQLRKKLARLQSRILWNTYQQRTYTARSMAALAEAGIDARVTTLPVARRIDALAQQRGDLLQARVKLQRERSENAKEVYRLWREKEIDIMEGYPVPQTQRNRLALLSNNSGNGINSGAGVGGGDGAVAMNASVRSARLSMLLKRNSAEYDS